MCLYIYLYNNKMYIVIEYSINIYINTQMNSDNKKYK